MSIGQEGHFALKYLTACFKVRSPFILKDQEDYIIILWMLGQIEGACMDMVSLIDGLKDNSGELNKELARLKGASDGVVVSEDFYGNANHLGRENTELSNEIEELREIRDKLAAEVAELTKTPFFAKLSTLGATVRENHDLCAVVRQKEAEYAELHKKFCAKDTGWNELSAQCTRSRMEANALTVQLAAARNLLAEKNEEMVALEGKYNELVAQYTDAQRDLDTCHAESADTWSCSGLRSPILKFARLMEEQMRANAHRGDYRDVDVTELLHGYLKNHGYFCHGSNDKIPKTKHAADLANFVMMVLDVEGLL